jgi:hypothetical protein
VREAWKVATASSPTNTLLIARAPALKAGIKKSTHTLAYVAVLAANESKSVALTGGKNTKNQATN